MAEAVAIQNILVVDDDRGLRETIADFLEIEGYAIHQAANVAEARKVFAESAPDLILLDINMPGGSGLSFAGELRGQSAVPIIILSGKGEMVDRVVGLEVGADDYLPKPFELRELLARVRAVLRRARPAAVATSAVTPASAPSQDREAHFGPFILNPSRRSVRTESGAAIELTGAEYNLLAALVDRANRVMTRDAIADLTRKEDWQGFDRSIDTLVSRLRRKLSPHADAAALIQTVRGEGYVLAASVSWVG
ncbi:MAG TPA: response regulator transcription factor [Hyphomonadaceae bacterium]|nr:response regulator transcription factor [Hyphomonadaceae bacterium]